MKCANASQDPKATARKIVHIDMDCFYASIEERDHPQLRGRPIGVGGNSRRGVLTTANYKAREFGCRSAMPVFKALELCPELELLPVRFDVYRRESAKIRRVFRRFTQAIEPLSLDEAYLDLSHLQSEAAALAREVRAQIFEDTGLTASAGIGPNKLIAKIASDWKKPNGQFEVKATEVSAFMANLPVRKLWGVGQKTSSIIENAGFKTCGDLAKLDRFEMVARFGRLGAELFDQARGIDHRPVKTKQVRKSISSERTFRENLYDLSMLRPKLVELIEDVKTEWQAKHYDRRIKSLVVKMKFADFSRTTAELASSKFDYLLFEHLLEQAFARGNGKGIRLIGAGVRLATPPNTLDQLDFTDTLFP